MKLTIGYGSNCLIVQLAIENKIILQYDDHNFIIEITKVEQKLIVFDA